MEDRFYRCRACRDVGNGHPLRCVSEYCICSCTAPKTTPEYVAALEDPTPVGRLLMASAGREYERRTVKRATLFDGVLDSFQTETELNGFRQTQGKML